MKQYGNLLLSRWFWLACLIGACDAGQVLNARDIHWKVTFCQVFTEPQVENYSLRLTITIDPAQVAPPDNVIVISTFSAANNVAPPYEIGATSLGNARGFATLEWKTNATWYPSESGTIVFSDTDTIVGNFKIGSDSCGLYTPPEYCITIKQCNSGIYHRKFFLSWMNTSDVASRLVSGYIAPGNCYTFPRICTKDKSSVLLDYTDLEETDTGFEQKAGPTEYVSNSDPAWRTNEMSAGTSTSTNYTIGPPAPAFNAANTNNQGIQFSGGTNAATDQTSKDGFNALYKATVEGFESTKTELRAGFGKLDTNIASGNNINRNGFLSLSNGLSGINGTLLGLSNGLKGELNSNNIFATRQNTSNTWETLRSLTNILGMTTANTNSPNPATQQSSGETAAEGTRDALLGLVGSIPNGGGSVPSDIGNWSFSVGAVSMDLNPLQGQFAGVASFIRNFILWCVTLCYIGFVITHTMETMRAVAAARQASAASATPGVSTGTALAMAAAITVAVATIPALLVATLNGGLLTTLGVSPFAGASGAIGMGIALANAYIPLDSILTYATAGLVFQLSIGALFWVATTVVRFLVGCIIFWACLSSVEARNLEFVIENNSGARKFFHIYFYTTEMALEPGQRWTSQFPIGDDGEVSFNTAAGTVTRSYEPLDWYASPDMSGVIYYLDSNGSYYVQTYKTHSDWVWLGMTWGTVTCAFGLVILVVRGIRNQTSEV